MTVNNYSFGKININGKVYTHDVIIMPDSIKSNWWRNSSHLLILEDIPELIDNKPDVLIIGTGRYGLMKVEKEVINYCKNNKIKLIIENTSNAIKKFNNLSQSNNKVIAALHLTC
ncbi:MAG: hypothetical protein KAW87_03975 [Candidatus Cloacimonetes bacterium]|nr:hypothetical protein [Candidatus Cloacimonadota bacterium]